MKTWHKIGIGIGVMAGGLAGVSVAIPNTVDISSAQTDFLTKNGKYEQVIDGKTLDGVRVQYKGLPANASVDVYESLSGNGYAVRWKDATGSHSRGYGPQAQQYTFDYAPPDNSASTTPL